MTDNDIIKALECCINGKCNGCPLYAMNCSPKVAMAFSADLITRQKAEIERLQELNKVLETDNFNANMNAELMLAENKELKKGFEADSDRFASEYDSKIRAEAINEFAERFLEIIHNNHYLLRTNLNSTDYGMFTLGIEQALNEAKEMVGET